MNLFSNITFGRYIDTGSVVHRLDPRTKLLTLIAVSLVVFYKTPPSPTGALHLAAMLCVSLLIVALSKIRILYVVKCIMKFLWFFGLIIIFHAFFTPGEVVPYLARYSIIVTYEGLINAAFMTLQLFIVIQYTYIFILTTSPLEITNAIKKLLSFLKLVKVPVDDVAMMVTLVIKFIPAFFKEADKILAAQRARGVVFREGGVTKRIKALSRVITPIFYNTFKRADELNTAMISRGYHAGAKRSSYKNIRLRVPDYFVLVIVSLLMISM